MKLVTSEAEREAAGTLRFLRCLNGARGASGGRNGAREASLRRRASRRRSGVLALIFPFPWRRYRPLGLRDLPVTSEARESLPGRSGVRSSRRQ
ncbi:hypothetical protein EYF80_028290 [Liparis tanakae]|uniref:Uncharacterized protein n=1 Tax=Liparis tanakae TaxID=230148 RepID=A0A4Z2H8G5_9TELE|nr:hypothetical protein EYF80_028290 [Liparis tanakae]